MRPVDRLSDYDAAFLYGETATAPLHSVNIAVIEGKLSMAEVHQLVTERIHKLPRLRQKLAFVPFQLAHPEWVDAEDFDLVQHISYEKLKGAKIKQAIHHGLVLAQPLLNRTRPLWRLHIIAAKGKTLLVSVVHNALIGTNTSLDFLNNLFDLNPQPKSPVSAPVWAPAPHPNTMDLTGAAVRDNTRKLAAQGGKLRTIRAQTQLLQQAAEFMTRFATEPAMRAQWNRGVVGRERIFHSVTFASAELRKVKHRCGGSLNDLAASLAVEAAARYLAARNEATVDRRLRVMQPVLVRREDSDGVRDNRMSAVFPAYAAEPTSMMERLKEVRWEQESIKHNREAQALQLIMELAPSLPPLPTFDNRSDVFGPAEFDYMNLNPTSWMQCFSPIYANRLPSSLAPIMTGFNFTMSTTRGAQTDQYCAGRPVKQIHCVPTLMANLGVGVNIIDYNKSICFNLSADPARMADLPAMGELIQSCFAELQSSVMNAA
ncbi:MAG: wax ester/triacylglycerol synthase domain-containing protein [Pseudomonadota bacterium]